MPDMKCPVCGSTAIEYTASMGCSIPDCPGNKLTPKVWNRLDHNARVAEAAEWYEEAHAMDIVFNPEGKLSPKRTDGYWEWISILQAADRELRQAVRASRDCRGEEVEWCL